MPLSTGGHDLCKCLPSVPISAVVSACLTLCLSPPPSGPRLLSEQLLPLGPSVRKGLAHGHCRDAGRHSICPSGPNTGRAAGLLQPLRPWQGPFLECVGRIERAPPTWQRCGWLWRPVLRRVRRHWRRGRTTRLTPPRCLGCRKLLVAVHLGACCEGGLPKSRLREPKAMPGCFCPTIAGLQDTMAHLVFGQWGY